MPVRDLTAFLRVSHWYKNGVVLLGSLMAGGDLLSSLLVLAAACLVSSASYIINQVTDVMYDRKHPEKRLRPFASGKIRKSHAFIALGILLAASLAISLFLSPLAGLYLAALLSAGMVYNLKPIRTKDIPYLDAISESVNNPIRFLAGWYAVSSIVPRWDVALALWALGASLMTYKRRRELAQENKILLAYRPTLARYSPRVLDLLILAYALLAGVLLL